MPTERQISSFIAVAETGSFLKASEKCFITSTAILQQMNLLEAELGFELFFRSHKGVVLTEAGEYYYNQISQIQKQIEAVTETARSIAKNERLHLRMGYIAGQAAQTAMELSQQISMKSPYIQLDLVQTHLKDALKEIELKILDCCLVPEGVIHENMESEIVKQCPLWVALSPELKISEKKKIKLSDLQGQKVVLPKRGTFLSTDKIEEQLLLHKVSYTKIEITDHIETELACIKEKACRIASAFVPGSKLIYRPLDEEIYFNLQIIYLKENRKLMKTIL